MTRMLNMRDVIELVNYRFYDRAFVRQEFIRQSHKLILHVSPGLSKKLNIEG